MPFQLPFLRKKPTEPALVAPAPVTAPLLSSGHLAVVRALLADAEPRQVSVGYTDLYLSGPDELEAEQLGFARDSNGKDLTGRLPGQWRPEWIVIGHEDKLGDPIFIDLLEPGYPVYTAMHDALSYGPMLLASSFQTFMQGLRAVAAYASDRSSPVELEANPLSEADRAALIGNLECLGPNADLDFWTGWFETE